MQIIKAIIIAFSMYSQIPMPQFEWKDEDMKYMLCFFPWVGIITGVCVYFWKIICAGLEIGVLCYTTVGMAIPLLITGGFHVDGFMDTMDAFHSYRPKEEKLMILKDSHIGAFAVIMLVLYGLVYAGAFSEIQCNNLLKIVCAGFWLSRVLSGISVVTFPTAKKEGMLYLSADSSQKNIVRGTLYLQGIMCIGFMLWCSLYAGGIAVATALCTFVYYYYRCQKELGGITGDTAGWFVLICEGSIMTAMALINIAM